MKTRVIVFEVAAVVFLSAGMIAWSADIEAVLDSNNGSSAFASSESNQFRVRAEGNVEFTNCDESMWITLMGSGNLIDTSSGARLTYGGTWADASDVNLKENFETIDPRAVLEALVDLPVRKWNYKSENDEIKHIGPTAQDFYAAFGVGHDDKSISGTDRSGVVFLAIQALQAENANLRVRIEHLEKLIETTTPTLSLGTPCAY